MTCNTITDDKSSNFASHAKTLNWFHFQNLVSCLQILNWNHHRLGLSRSYPQTLNGSKIMVFIFLYSANTLQWTALTHSINNLVFSEICVSPGSVRANRRECCIIGPSLEQVFSAFDILRNIRNILRKQPLLIWTNSAQMMIAYLPEAAALPSIT